MSQRMQDSRKRKEEKQKSETCCRLDEQYCMDDGTMLVKKKYGMMDEKSAMDCGLMLR